MKSFDIDASTEKLNTVLGWLLTAIVGLATLEYLLSANWLWSSFAIVCLLVILVPPLLTRNWAAMAPGPLLVLVTIGIVAGGNQIFPETAGYVAVASLGVLIAIELDVFTSVEMSRRFALGFAVLSTLAVQGFWTIGQYYSDLWFETSFLTSQRELQVDIVIVTVIGLTTGVLFEWYFKKVSHGGSHMTPSDISKSR